MSYRRGAMLACGLVYALLWGVALNGANGLIGPLAVPLILVVLVGGGNWLSNFMGLSAKAPKFRNPRDEE